MDAGTLDVWTLLPRSTRVVLTWAVPAMLVAGLAVRLHRCSH